MKRTIQITSALLLAMSFSATAFAKKGALKPIHTGKAHKKSLENTKKSVSEASIAYNRIGEAKAQGRLAPLTPAQKAAQQIVSRVEVYRPENISSKETILNIITNKVDAGSFNHSMALRIQKRNTELRNQMTGDHLTQIINTTEDGRTRNPKEPCKPKGA